MSLRVRTVNLGIVLEVGNRNSTRSHSIFRVFAIGVERTTRNIRELDGGCLGAIANSCLTSRIGHCVVKVQRTRNVVALVLNLNWVRYFVGTSSIHNADYVLTNGIACEQNVRTTTELRYLEDIVNVNIVWCLTVDYANHDLAIALAVAINMLNVGLRYLNIKSSILRNSDDLNV